MRTLLLILALSAAGTAHSQTLVHYWNFNGSDITAPSVSLTDGAFSADLADLSELIAGTGQDFAGINARNGDPAGAHLRLNNPIGSSITFHLPTTGFENPVVRYETRRSGSGANTQYISYSLNGIDYTPIDTIAPPDGVPTLVELDFSDVAAADDNAHFHIRIRVEQIENGTGGTAGNNRFDNLTLDATALPGVNRPPVLAVELGFRETAVGLAGIPLDPATLFTDPDDDPLTVEITSNRPEVASCATYTVSSASLGSTCQLTGSFPGDATITLTATDGKSDPVTATFRLLVHPSAHRLSPAAPFAFTEWSADEPSGAYPPNMIFLQSDRNDPGLTDALRHPYRIPLADAADPADADFPYKAASRTRINGLGAEGISFINTGRGRDIGGAVVSVNLTNVASASIGFTASTLTANFRTYNLRLLYRVGLETEWKEVGGSTPIEYQRNPTAGTDQAFSGIPVPADAFGHPYVQFLWKYYYTGTQLDGGGARDQIRLDDITLTDLTGTSTPDDGRTTPDTFALLETYPNPFNPKAVIRFTIVEAHQDAPLRLTVHDILGREVAVLVDGVLPAGSHQAVFDATGMASGLYLVRLQAGDEVRTRRITLLK